MPGDRVSAYAAIHARVRAMVANLLAPTVWQGLCEAPAFGALVNMLKATVYGPYLTQVDEKALTPRRAVYQVKMHLANAFATVIRMAPRHTRSLCLQMARIFEIDNVKAVLRGLVAGASWDQVRYVLFPLNGFTDLPAQEMVEAEGVSAAVDLLRGTPYYETLIHAMNRYTAEQSLFPLEVALDLAYWRELWRDVNQLSGADREQAIKLVGSLVDMNNLMWAIRYRIFHRLAEEEIINYTLPFGVRVRDRHIRAIAAGADVAQVLASIYPDLPDANAFLQSEGRLSNLEIELQQRIAVQCHAAFIGYPFHIGIPLAFLLLTEFEIQDLTVLIEAKSMQLPPETFSPYLVNRPQMLSTREPERLHTRP